MAALTPGNIFVPSDNFDFTPGDAAEINATTGAMVQTLSFDRATKGDILPSGIFCMAVENGTGTILQAIKIYSADGATVLASVTTWSVGSRSVLCPIYAWGDEHFFVMIPKNAGDPSVRLVKLATDGSVVQQWDLPNNANFADNLAISPDGAVAYYGFKSTAPIRRFDLVNSIALSDLVATVSGRNWCANFVVDASGNLLVPMYDNATYPQCYVHKYSPAGSLLDTYDIGDSNYEVPEVFTDPDGAYFWARNFPTGDGSTSTFYRINNAANTSTSFTVDTLEGSGVVPSTCPNFIVRGPVAPVILPVPTPTPQTPGTCTPQTQTGNGGKGQAGCNTGGIGSTRSYDGPWGTVPQHPDPGEGESLAGKERYGVEPYIELHHVSNDGETVTVYRRALVPLGHHADKDGYKPDGLLAVGDIEHALGNERGGIEAATVSLQFTDVRDRLFRRLLADEELEGDELYVKVTSDPAAEDAA